MSSRSFRWTCLYLNGTTIWRLALTSGETVLTEHNRFFEHIADYFVPIHRDGQKFVAASLVATVILLLVWAPLGWLAAIFTAWIAYIFRDPDRVVPTRDGLLVAPSDGSVEYIEEVLPDTELDLGPERRVRISIHLSLFDGHITRTPVAGTIVRMLYIPGLFASVHSPKSSEDNERRAYIIEMASGDRIAVVQIAGGIRRRIVAFQEEGARMGIGERIGLIRFGSRVDLYLPAGFSALVAVGQSMIGGETVVGDLKSDEKERSARVV